MRQDTKRIVSEAFLSEARKERDRRIIIAWGKQTQHARAYGA